MALEWQIPAGDQSPGARLVTRAHGSAQLAGLRLETGLCRPVRFAAGTFGRDSPEAALRLGPGTLMPLTGWRTKTLYGAPAVHLPAGRLAGCAPLARERPRRLTLYTPVFDAPQSVCAGSLMLGMPVA